MKQRLKKLLSMLLTVAMIFNIGLTPVFAIDANTAQACDCLTTDSGALTHTEDCPLYTKPVCTCAPVDSGEQIHGKGWPLYTTPALSEAVKALIAMVDALPNAEDITEDNKEATLPAFDAAQTAYEALSSDDKAAFEATEQYKKLMALHTALYSIAQMANVDEWDISKGDLNLSNSCGGTCAGHTVTGETTTYKILVDGGTHNVTLDGVTIDVNGTESACTFEIKGGATVNLTLTGTNVLKSGMYRAGLEVIAGNTLTITSASTGSLDATGGYNGAGIGGCWNGAGGTITISGGTVTATGGENGAGIGGGASGAGGTITISGGTVTATAPAGGGGAGIGGGVTGAGGTINISGGTVTGTGGNSGAGIGGGFMGAGGTITIDGSAVVYATKGTDAPNHIGAGAKGTDDTVNKDGGIIFEGESGGVYSCSLEKDFTVESAQSLEIVADKTLTVPSGITLTNNGTINNLGTITNKGTLSGNGSLIGDGVVQTALTGSMISLDQDSYVYTGSAFEPNVTVATPWTGVSPFAKDTDFTVGYTANTVAGTATVTVTPTGSNLTGSPVNKTFTITQSDTAFTGGIKTYKDTNEQSTFTYGDTITVKVTVSVTGTAPAPRSRAVPTANQMALFKGNVQLTDPQTVISGTELTFTIATTDKQLAIGENAITAKYVESTNMAGHEQTITVTLNKKPLTATVNTSHASATKVYDGNAIFTGVALILTGLEAEDNDITATASGTAASKDVGAEQSFTCTGVTVGGTHGGYYSLAHSAVTGNVGIMAVSPTYSVADQNIKIGKTLTAIQASGAATGVNGESVAGTLTWAESSGGNALTNSYAFTGNAGDTKTLYWTFAPTSGNYKTLSGSTVFTLTNKEVPVLTINNIEKTYDGKAVTTVTGTAKVDSTTVAGTFAFDGAPPMKDADIYNVTVKFTPTDSANYEIATTTITVTINKATITIQANNKSAYVGDTAPALSASDYTISGLASGETLETLPTIAYESTPDMSKAGEVAIVVSGAAAPHGGNYNEIVYQSGTLTISKKSSGGGGGVTPTPDPKPENPNAHTTAQSNVNSKTDKNGNATAAVAGKDITNAIDKAQKEAKKNGTEANGIAITLNVKTDKNATTLGVTLLKQSVSDLVAANVTQVTIKNSLSTVTLNLATLKALAGGDVILTVSKADTSKLSKEAQNAIGNRPVFRFGISVGGKAVTDLKGGRVGLQMLYTRSTTEQASNLCGVYVDGNGKVTYLANSSYHVASKTMLINATHLSVYGVAYKANVPTFTDTTSHWAKDDIAFVAARGLLTGTGNSKFSPNGSITRGAFITALGRLAGVNTKKYQSTKFTDVKASAYYAPYVAWAKANNIANGTSDTTFSPNKTVTRQEVAIILSNYVKAIGYKLPRVHAEISFVDSSSIASWAKDAVKQMQMAGILMGKDGGKFAPTYTATRAEVSAMLRRYVESVANTETAEGWATNDSGSWMYFKNGKAVTGKKNIGNTTYEFDKYGITALPPKDRRYTLYIVQKGDSFWAIASKYKINIFDLVSLNGKTISSAIYAGDELKIPQK